MSKFQIIWLRFENIFISFITKQPVYNYDNDFTLYQSNLFISSFDQWCCILLLFSLNCVWCVRHGYYASNFDYIRCLLTITLKYWVTLWAKWMKIKIRSVHPKLAFFYNMEYFNLKYIKLCKFYPWISIKVIFPTCKLERNFWVTQNMWFRHWFYAMTQVMVGVCLIITEHDIFIK